MLDKVILKLHRNQIPAGYDWTSVIDNLYVSNQYYCNDSSAGGGKYRGRKIFANDDMVRFEGSLPKCLYGDNIHILSLSQVQDVIETMSKELGVPMMYAEVESLEFSTNLIMSRPPQEYMSRMGALKGMTFSNHSGSPYFESKDMKIKFYDKVQEAKKKREISSRDRRMIEPYQLRFEITFKKRMLQKMFGRTLIASDLWDKRVFWRFVAEWFGIYEEIEKKPDSALDISFDDLRGRKDLYYWAVCALNEHLDISSYLRKDLFKNRKNPQYQDSVRHHTLQSALEESKKWGLEHIKPSGLIEELDACIEQYLTQLLEVSPDGLTEEEERLLFS